MYIQEETILEAVTYLFGLDVNDINPAFKGHAKDWLHELRLAFKACVNRHKTHLGWSEQESVAKCRQKLLEPANHLVGILTPEAKEHFLAYLAQCRKSHYQAE